MTTSPTTISTTTAAATTTTTPGKGTDSPMVYIEAMLFSMLVLILLIIVCAGYVHVKNLYYRSRYGVTAIYQQVEAECRGVSLGRSVDEPPYQSIYMPD
ncbi:envelope glycoprotein 150 [Equid gammaherpesvirus 2]|nr:envelope glycoprotein 150 [Equid gammaherpesvirus 2]